MFREEDERIRNLHPSYRNKPISAMQMLSQNARLDDSAMNQKINNCDRNGLIPDAVPVTYDTMYDPTNPQADWTGMVSLKYAHKKHITGHASQQLGIEQSENGIIAKVTKISKMQSVQQ